MNRTVWPVLLAMLLVGFIAGFAVATVLPGDPPPPLAPAPSVKSSSVPSASVARPLSHNDVGVMAKDSAIDGRATPRPPASSVSDACTPLREEVANLQGQLQSAERKLAFERSLREAFEGTPVAFPSDVAERFQEEALVEHLTDAIRATGIDAAIEHVSCEEFPCIAYGTVASDISTDVAMADLKLLHEQTHGKAYANDLFYISHTTQEPGPDGQGEPMVVFNIAYYPEAMPAEERTMMEKRMKLRKDRTFEALRSP